MALMVGSNTGANYHLTVPRLKLSGAAQFDWTLDKVARIGREFGFSPMGISFGVARLPRTDRSYLDEVRARLKENNLLPQVGVSRVQLHNSPDVFQPAMRQAIADLDVAAQLGSTISIVHHGEHGRATREGLVRSFVKALGELGRAARSRGIGITSENYRSFTADEYVRTFQEVGLENVGIQVDTGNWLCNGEDPLEATRKVLPWVIATHVKDYVLEDETYNGVAVGSGLVDYGRVLPLLAQAGEKRDLVLTVELDTDDRDEDEELHKSYAFIKDWLIRNRHTKYLTS
jgi:sugar phosphate isomerase/epimerase